MPSYRAEREVSGQHLQNARCPCVGLLVDAVAVDDANAHASSSPRALH